MKHLESKMICDVEVNELTYSIGNYWSGTRFWCPFWSPREVPISPLGGRKKPGPRTRDGPRILAPGFSPAPGGKKVGTPGFSVTPVCTRGNGVVHHPELSWRPPPGISLKPRSNRDPPEPGNSPPKKAANFSRTKPDFPN